MNSIWCRCELWWARTSELHLHQRWCSPRTDHHLMVWGSWLSWMVPHCNLRRRSLCFPSRYIVVLYFHLALPPSLPATLMSLMQWSDALDTIGLWPTLLSCTSLVFYSSIVLCTSRAASKNSLFLVWRAMIYCTKGGDLLSTKLTNPGHHLTAEALKIAEHLENRSSSTWYNLIIRWTAGHVGIKGNENADKEAKRAAQGLSSERKDLPKSLRGKIKHSVSGLRQKNNKKLNEIWKNQWQSLKRFKRLQAKDTIPPASQKYLTLTSDHRISRNMASTIFQLRVGHVPLNKYLHWFKKVDHVRCPACGDQVERVEHFLIHCPKYAHERWPLLQKLKRTVPLTTEILFNKSTILSLINFIEATKRFRVQPMQEQGWIVPVGWWSQCHQQKSLKSSSSKQVNLLKIVKCRDQQSHQEQVQCRTAKLNKIFENIFYA